MNYQKYNEQMLNLLIDEVQKATGKRWEDGLWAPKKVRRPHILPLLMQFGNIWDLIVRHILIRISMDYTHTHIILTHPRLHALCFFQN